MGFEPLSLEDPNNTFIDLNMKFNLVIKNESALSQSYRQL